ncbi:MAG: alpha/beta fold hydrolase [Alphaproteobacteria bacterium]|nr:alpha/beta fold hydrolase [Alphaproteobacteria bacterium]
MADGLLELLRSGPPGGDGALVLAHGAGAGMRSPFMEAFAEGLGERGIPVYRFEFPYMRAMTASGRRRPPNPEAILRRCWAEAIDRLTGRPLVIGGKSLGGRIASLIADESAVAGLVCLGYPFHPPGRPERTRTAHLADLRTPTLICQGTRDPFGSFAEIGGYRLSPAITVQWLEDGNHSLEPRRSSGRTIAGNWNDAMDRIAEFTRAACR